MAFCVGNSRVIYAGASKFLILLDLGLMASEIVVKARNSGHALAFRFGPHADQIGPIGE